MVRVVALCIFSVFSSGCILFLLCISQVVGGVALCALAPLQAGIGINLVMEGISDCYKATKGMHGGLFQLEGVGSVQGNQPSPVPACCRNQQVI